MSDKVLKANLTHRTCGDIMFCQNLTSKRSKSRHKLLCFFAQISSKIDLNFLLPKIFRIRLLTTSPASERFLCYVYFVYSDCLVCSVWLKKKLTNKILKFSHQNVKSRPKSVFLPTFRLKSSRNFYRF